MHSAAYTRTYLIRDAAEAPAELFRSIGHPFRLRLLEELAKEEECVCHLSSLFEKPQPYISQQLAALRDAGLLRDRREGQRIFYSLADTRILGLLAVAREMAGGAAPAPTARTVVSGCPCPKCCDQTPGSQESKQ